MGTNNGPKELVLCRLVERRINFQTRMVRWQGRKRTIIANEEINVGGLTQLGEYIIALR